MAKLLLIKKEKRNKYINTAELLTCYIRDNLHLSLLAILMACLHNVWPPPRDKKLQESTFVMVQAEMCNVF